ncbi:Spy/CpxP family protein refolding chaperone [Geothrix sp. PMB-07]|uniref:Spy/CpxP family protein refolding chaperone n=1 Tax=Geothrix sp. PMB-07 TaxID=3068640 RepID=UPI0027427BA9|nr:Spy/CpxP family protein refolding chaperone [Geothrix sp. PMB-07]WLT32667.1 Spy/CpxP family protein refolding chaperone [Geothrix sp. PMB-07]
MTFMRHTAFCIAMAALPLSAQAGPGHSPRAEWTGRGMNLTEAQQSSIKAIRDKHRPDLLLRRDAAKQAQTALQAALQDSTTPEAQLRSLHDKASAARFDLMLAQRSLHQEVQAILTPEQRAKAAERHALARVKRQERMRHLRMAAGMPG